MFRKIIALHFLIYGLTLNVYSKVTLPALLSNNLVMQQNSNVKLWGGAKKSAKISVFTSWDKKTYKLGSDANGNWEMTIASPSAGGPYFIKFNDGEETLIDNILFGEVWVCSGQSNMAMKLKGSTNQPVNNFIDVILETNNDQIRVFTVANKTAAQPVNDLKGNWKVSRPETAMEASAVAYIFAQQLQKYLKVPVGVIVSAWGATSIRAWMPEANLKQVPGMSLEISKELTSQDPTVLYNAMISPLTSYPIRGFLWYQGEADTKRSEVYEQLMIEMVKGWRDAWKLGELPFYFVQIAPFPYSKTSEVSVILREKQLEASHSIPNSGIAITLDLGTESIHPPEKIGVAKRLLYLALAKTYNVTGIPYAGPEFKKMSVEGKKAFITFSNADRGLYLKNKTSSNFEMAGADKVFYPASATVTLKGLEVKSDAVDKPVAVRYAFKNYVIGDLYNTFGLPASSFRTDDWEVK